MTDTPVRPPVGRYGPVRPRSRAWRFVGWGALAALVLAVVVWVGGSALEDPVQWKDVGFDVTDASSTDVTFDVTKGQDETASCRVRALSQSFGEVGVRTVEVGPADTDTVRVTVTVPTAELAVSGGVQTCHVR
ncbi:DUF4307 domain-containing protein [Cellulomonas rhizosphaerae]|uniref:DUF4307 domain-containing protein n=1 Tax=Cellulomonas rhizosphaerae TaxID=2293719 RepID=A0A413RNQ6_9CELL|nr:DUF4307 domain-containing protein [Cellulomonas rhizosphaerae]RHA43652.1 DUF4307 domain-containing protein [Cellulomonas rhizosphaerae]